MPMERPLNELTATEIAAAVAAGQAGAEEVVRACLDRVRARDAAVRAWSYVDPATVLRQARELDKRPHRGPPRLRPSDRRRWTADARRRP